MQKIIFCNFHAMFVFVKLADQEIANISFTCHMFESHCPHTLYLNVHVGISSFYVQTSRRAVFKLYTYNYVMQGRTYH